MRTLNVVLEDRDYERLEKAKGDLTWRAYLTQATKGIDLEDIRSYVKAEILKGRLKTPEDIVNQVLELIA